MRLDIVAVVVSILGQLFAAVTALRMMGHAGRIRFAWGAVSLGLTLMLGRRVADALAVSQHSGPPAGGVYFAAVVSLLLAVGLYGVKDLFAELERTKAELYEEATRDELTHLSNRRHVLLMARHEVERARRSGRPVTFLLLDVDHFKKVNDTLGHERGDEVLRCVTKTCSSELRAADPFGRIGGDEFLAVLPELGLEAAERVAQRLREAVTRGCSAQVGLSSPLTISIGCSSLPDADLSAEELVAAALAQADDALYQAKEAGRDRVVMRAGNGPLSVGA